MAAGKALSPSVSGLMVLLELGGTLACSAVGNQTVNTLSWSLSLPVCPVWVYAVEPDQNTWLGAGGFLWLISRIPFRAVLLLPGSEQESPLIIDNNSNWQLLYTSCG